jgi:probable HAF family extracellular repeat protein
MRIIRSLARVFVPFSFGCVVAHAAPVYTVTPIGPAGSSQSIPLGINNAGQVVGNTVIGSTQSAFLYSNGASITFGDTSSATHLGSLATAINDSGQIVLVEISFDPATGVRSTRSYLYSNGLTTEIVGLGVPRTQANDINNIGQVVGGSNQNGPSFAFLYQNGTEALPLGDAWFSEAYAINDSGQIVGSRGLPGEANVRPFVFSNGVTTDIVAPGAVTGLALDINNDGQVVGYFQDAVGVLSAFTFQNGALTLLGGLGGNSSFADSINSRGQIVGQSQIADGTYHAFLYDNGMMTDLTELIGIPLAAGLLSTLDINDNGQISYYGYDSQGAPQAFLLTPTNSVSTIPTLFLAIAALALLVLQAQKRSVFPTLVRSNHLA